MLVLLWSMQCLVVCMLTIEVCQQFFCTFCVVRGQVVLHLLLLVCSVQFLECLLSCSRLLDHVVDVGVLLSKIAVVAEVVDVSSKKLLWFARFEVADVLE